MKKTLIVSLFITVILPVTGCSLVTGEHTCDIGEPMVDTEFGRMLEYIPLSVLEKYDIWFDNWGKVKQMYDIEDITSIEIAKTLPQEELDVLRVALSEISGMWRLQNSELSPLIGFDCLLVDRIIRTDSPPPRSFSVVEGNFDEELITGLLTGLDYTSTAYGEYSYYEKGADFEIDMTSPLGQVAMASLNRIAVLDNTLIIAPATDIVTPVLDTISGSIQGTIDNQAVRALADSLGDVISAGIITPERVLTPPGAEQVPPFDFKIPDDWGVLHPYEMVGMGYRSQGEDRYWDISLYYASTDDARADSAELVKRLNSYYFNTQFADRMDPVPLTALYVIGDATVTEYSEGATLTVSCRLVPGSFGASYPMGALGLRDLLFLAPDPSLYVAE
jgi:hypothetical protein